VRTALRDRFPGALESQVRDHGRDAKTPYLLITLRPPRHEPDPRHVE